MGRRLDAWCRRVAAAVAAALLMQMLMQWHDAHAAADAPSPPTPPPAEKSASSPAETAAERSPLLQRLWTAEQLRGAPRDPRTRRLRPPDRSPPEGAQSDAVTPADPSLAFLPAAPLPDAWRGSIRRVRLPDDQRLVALTFDLCERADEIAGYDGAVVDALRAEGASATFFAGGKWLRSHPDRAQQVMADPRFEVGSHAWTHGNLRVLSGDKAEQQIVWPQIEFAHLRAGLARRAEEAGVPADAIARLPAAPMVFRFPYGVCSREALEATARYGLAAVQWDVISGDAVRGTQPSTLVRTVLQAVKPGAIVVFHANGRGNGTAAALPEIVRGLRAKGYRMVTVSELLRAGVPEAAPDCYELRPGDNKRYDALFGEGTG